MLCDSLNEDKWIYWFFWESGISYWSII
jgi:hypothetical protein